MRRNWKTLKIVLEHIESEDFDEFTGGLLDREKSGTSCDDDPSFDNVLGHLWLCTDADLVVGADVRKNAVGVIHCRLDKDLRLTMQGHDVLDALRSNTVWKKVTDTARAVSIPLTVDLIKSVISSLAKSAC